MTKIEYIASIVLKELLDFFNIEDDNPDSTCYEASGLLYEVLTAYNIPCKPVHGTFIHKWVSYDHMWVELQNGTIIDITADQFGNYPKIFIANISKLYSKTSIAGFCTGKCTHWQNRPERLLNKLKRILRKKL